MPAAPCVGGENGCHMIRAAVFDFDGTIADSSEGVFMCVLYALENMGRPLPGRDELRKFIGPPLRESFSRRCGMTTEETERAVELYRRMYSDGAGLAMLIPAEPFMLVKIVAK